jgi:molybdopterin/thiamine biosynthesis adenylyltransferase
MKSHLYIIGVGGGGSWLTPAMSLLTSPEQITLIDGDKLEQKNLNRQLFDETDVGRNKAEALSAKYHTSFIADWFCDGLLEFQPEDWLMVCVDNNPARRSALIECDRYGCRAIFAANETNSAEAYYYQPSWKDTMLDPRLYYNLSGSAGDPRRASIGCTGEAQASNPQLVTSNMMAASLAGHLFSLWHLQAPKLSRKTLASLCYKFVANANKLESFRVRDVQPKEERTDHVGINQ